MDFAISCRHASEPGANERPVKRNKRSRDIQRPDGLPISFTRRKFCARPARERVRAREEWNEEWKTRAAQNGETLLAHCWLSNKRASYIIAQDHGRTPAGWRRQVADVSSHIAIFVLAPRKPSALLSLLPLAAASCCFLLLLPLAPAPSSGSFSAALAGSLSLSPWRASRLSPSPRRAPSVAAAAASSWPLAGGAAKLSTCAAGSARPPWAIQICA